jgi:hypothetical protein
MKPKKVASAKKQPVIVKDLKTRKNPKGGAMVDHKLHYNIIKL